MEKKVEKGSEEWQFFRDFLKYREKYYIAESDDWFGDALLPASEGLIAKYSNSEIAVFVRQMVFTNIEDVERRWKLQHEKSKNI